MIDFQTMNKPNSKEEWAKLLARITEYENSIEELKTSYFYKSFRSAIPDALVNVNDGPIKLLDKIKWKSAQDKEEDLYIALEDLYIALKYYVQQLNFYAKQQEYFAREGLYTYKYSGLKSEEEVMAGIKKYDIFEWLMEWSFYYWKKNRSLTYYGLLKTSEELSKETSSTVTSTKKTALKTAMQQGKVQQQPAKTTPQQQTNITILNQKIQDHNKHLANGTFNFRTSAEFLNLYIAWTTLEIQKVFIYQYQLHRKQLLMKSTPIDRSEKTIKRERKGKSDIQYSVESKSITRDTPQFECKNETYDLAVLKAMDTTLDDYVRYYEKICNEQKELSSDIQKICKKQEEEGIHNLITTSDMQSLNKDLELAQYFILRIQEEYALFRLQLKSICKIVWNKA